MANRSNYPEIPEHQILGRLGWGGMGVVYKAREIDLGREVALKVMPSTGKWSRFQREMQALARVSDPGVVRLFRHGHTEDYFYYSMELVEGQSLASILATNKEKQQLPRGDELKAWVRRILQIAQTMVHAHAKGVFHRDLTPSNVLVLPAGQTKVIDFGLAEVLDQATTSLTGTAFGTPRYLPPEVLVGRGEKRGSTQDVYSLGVILFEAVTCNHPYPHVTFEELLLRMPTAEPERPRRFHRGLSRDLEAVILKAIAKSPADRYPDMAGFSSDLENWLERRSVTARSSTTSTRILHALRLRTAPGQVFAFTLAFLALLGVAYVPYSRWKAEVHVGRAVDTAISAFRGGNIAEFERLIVEMENRGATHEAQQMRILLTINEKRKAWRGFFAEIVEADFGDKRVETRRRDLERLRAEIGELLEKLNPLFRELLEETAQNP